MISLISNYSIIFHRVSTCASIRITEGMIIAMTHARIRALPAMTSCMHLKSPFEASMPFQQNAETQYMSNPILSPAHLNITHSEWKRKPEILSEASQPHWLNCRCPITTAIASIRDKNRNDVQNTVFGCVSAGISLCSWSNGKLFEKRLRIFKAKRKNHSKTGLFLWSCFLL